MSAQRVVAKIEAGHRRAVLSAPRSAGAVSAGAAPARANVVQIHWRQGARAKRHAARSIEMSEGIERSFGRAVLGCGRSLWALRSEAESRTNWQGLKRKALIAWQGIKVEALREDQVCRLTSQWNGRLRAAHSGAVHRRVRFAEDHENCANHRRRSYESSRPEFP